ncbi:unnamed protein product [Oppiella nova]|uniref:Uncharacterized protein n=1 Tax=Oppiella nova TaxID=334625 RepID=A0A7R9QTJ2_9ACAR|nr:unnamed protein product [Oppiella nova]CAG2175000.1 unnamed protein product [Oppiella nova]
MALPSHLDAAFIDENRDKVYVKNNYLFWREYRSSIAMNQLLVRMSSNKSRVKQIAIKKANRKPKQLTQRSKLLSQNPKL